MTVWCGTCWVQLFLPLLINNASLVPGIGQGFVLQKRAMLSCFDILSYWHLNSLNLKWYIIIWTCVKKTCLASAVGPLHLPSPFFCEYQYSPPTLSSLAFPLHFAFSSLNPLFHILHLCNLSLSVSVPFSLDSLLFPHSCCLVALGMYSEWQNFALSLVLCACTVATHFKCIVDWVDLGTSTLRTWSSYAMNNPTEKMLFV